MNFADDQPPCFDCTGVPQTGPVPSLNIAFASCMNRCANALQQLPDAENESMAGVHNQLEVASSSSDMPKNDTTLLGSLVLHRRNIEVKSALAARHVGSEG